MTDQILEYEKFIKKETSKKLDEKSLKRLAKIHRETVANFQHERLVHLSIMLFFIAVSLVLLTLLFLSFLNSVSGFEMLPFYVLVALAVVLTFFYVKHYYFLENHIQALYKYTKILNS